jgi:hypothetical protein
MYIHFKCFFLNLVQVYNWREAPTYYTLSCVSILLACLQGLVQAQSGISVVLFRSQCVCCRRKYTPITYKRNAGIIITAIKSFRPYHGTSVCNIKTAFGQWVVIGWNIRRFNSSVTIVCPLCYSRTQDEPLHGDATEQSASRFVIESEGTCRPIERLV